MDRRAGPKGPITVVVGAGMGGVVVSRRLRDRLPRDHRVLVVDRRPEVSFAPSYLRVVAGERRPQQVSKRLSGLTRLGLEFRCAEVMGFEPANRTLEIAGDRVKADAVVLAPGVRLLTDRPPGVAGVAHHFHELDAALRLRGALGSFRGGRVLLAAASVPYRGPASLHEAALLIRTLLEKRAGVKVGVVTPEPGPWPPAGSAAAPIRTLLEARGIAVRYGARPVRVHSPTSTPAGSPPTAAVAGELELEDGTREPFDLLVMVPPHSAPGFLGRSGLVGRNGWVEVDRATLATPRDGVWAIGDVVHLKGDDGEPPRLGSLAEAMAETVAAEVAGRLTGTSDRRPFDGRVAGEIAVGDGTAMPLEVDLFGGAARLGPADRRTLERRDHAEKEWARRY